jgi:hypothetical protein
MPATWLTAKNSEQAAMVKLVPIFLLCMVKFVVGVPALYAATKWGFLPMFVFSTVSGCCGVVAFLFFERGLMKLWSAIKSKLSFKSRPSVPPKRFTKRSRMLVKIINSYGLPGIALITPTIISIPVGSILAGRLFHNHKRVFLFLSASVVLWSALLSSLLVL